MISFAGGLPAPELFDAAGLRRAFAEALSPARGGRVAAVLDHRGRPRAARRDRRPADRARPAGRGRRRAGDERLPAGTHARRHGAARARRRRARRGAVVPGGAAGVRARRRRAWCRCACDDDGLDPDAVAAAAAEHGARLLYTVPTFQNPTGRTLPPRAAARARRGRRARRAVAARGRPVRRAALPRRAAAEPGDAARRRGPHARALDALEGRRARACGSAGCARRRRCAARSWWPSRPPTCTPRPSTRRPPRRWLATVDLDAHIADLRAQYGARRDALLDGLAAALPPGSTHNRPDGGMFVWARLPDGWDAADLLRARARARRRVRARATRSSPGEPDHATLRFSFTTHPPEEIAEGLARLRGAWRKAAAP